MDSEKLDTVKTRSDESGLGGMICSIVGSVDIKVGFILFIVYILINTTIFVDKVLSKFDAASSMGAATEKGVAIQAMTLVLVYMFVEFLASKDVI